MSLKADPNVPAVSLTFDDGPDPVWTPRILDVLSDVGARATFFVISPLATEYSGIVERIGEEGHGIGLHCSRHVRHTEMTPTEIEHDTLDGLADLRELGVEPDLWRPPWGILTDATRDVAEKYGLDLTLWTSDTHDWRGDSARYMFEEISPALSGGSVVLMHDGIGPGARREDCSQTLELTRMLLRELPRMGLGFVTVGEAKATPGRGAVRG